MFYTREEHGDVLVETVDLARATLNEAEEFKLRLTEDIENGYKKGSHKKPGGRMHKNRTIYHNNLPLSLTTHEKALCTRQSYPGIPGFQTRTRTP